MDPLLDPLDPLYQVLTPWTPNRAGTVTLLDLPRITFHNLRHTCPSLLFSKNVPPKFVQELLGHASVAISLDTYSNMLPGMSGEATDAMGEALS